MRSSSWLTLTLAGYDGTTALIDVHVNRWHPGFWLFLVRSLVRPNATATGDHDLPQP